MRIRKISITSVLALILACAMLIGIISNIFVPLFIYFKAKRKYDSTDITDINTWLILHVFLVYLFHVYFLNYTSASISSLTMSHYNTYNYMTQRQMVGTAYQGLPTTNLQQQQQHYHPHPQQEQSYLYNNSNPQYGNYAATASTNAYPYYSPQHDR